MNRLYILFQLCSERESNPYGHFCPQDFKSCVSTYSTIRAERNINFKNLQSVWTLLFECAKIMNDCKLPKFFADRLFASDLVSVVCEIHDNCKTRDTDSVGILFSYYVRQKSENQRNNGTTSN